MKACGVSRAGGDVELLELPEPPAPGPGEILVSVEAAGVGPWDQLLNGAGWDVGLRPPAALGVEGTGRVIALGSGVDNFALGDRVLSHEAPLPGGSGFWAERVLLTAAHAALRPSGVTAQEAAALPVAGLTALQALKGLGLSRGQRLLVTNGGGATGAIAVQLAAQDGIKVTATASSRSVERLIGLGAAEIIDYRDSDWTRNLTGRFDAAMTLAPGSASAVLPFVRDGGRLCSLTSDAPRAEREITSWNLYVEPSATQLASLAERVASGSLKLPPESVPLAEAPRAYERVVTGLAGGKKFVLIVTE